MLLPIRLISRGLLSRLSTLHVSTQVPSSCLNIYISHRHLISDNSLPPDIDYTELKEKLEAKQIELYDVREAQELAEHGMVPNSHNLPLRALGSMILLPSDKFLPRKGYKKPEEADAMAVMCLGGLRARTAQLALIGAGYTNVRVYVGSFEDWSEKGGPLVYPNSE